MADSPGIIRARRYCAALIAVLWAGAFSPDRGVAGPQPTRYGFLPSTGEPRMLVILAATSGLLPTLTHGQIEARLFSRADDGLLSMAEYFDDVSYGALRLTGEVTPWLVLPRPMEEYAGNAFGARPLAFPKNLGGLAAEAVEAAHQAGVDFSRFDNDGDGHVDGLLIIYSGPLSVGERSPTRVWPRYDFISLYGHDPIPVDGKVVDMFAVCPEYVYQPEVNTVQVYAHEIGHTMGLPDLSDTDASSYGIGATDLMGWPVGNREILGPSAWSKALLGWIRPTPVSEPAMIELPPLHREPFAARMETGRKGEYFLLANRQAVGVDALLPGSGLLLWRVNERAIYENLFECKGPCRKTPRLALVQADNKSELERRENVFDPYDFFTGAPPTMREVGADTGPPDSPFTGAVTLSFAGLPTGVRIKDIAFSEDTARAQIITGDLSFPCHQGFCLSLLGAAWEEVRGDGDGFAEPGEKLNLVLTIGNLGGKTEGIYFYPSDPAVKWKYGNPKIESIGAGGKVEVKIGLKYGSLSLPPLFRAIARGFTDMPEQDGSGPVWFTPKIEVRTRAPASRKILQPRLVLGVPEIMVVDDSPHDLLPCFEDAVRALGVTYELWDVKEKGLPPAARAAGPALLVWLSGINPLDGSRYPGAERMDIFRAVIGNGRTLLWSSSLLSAPPPPELLDRFGAAAVRPGAGLRLARAVKGGPVPPAGDFFLERPYAPAVTPHLQITPDSRALAGFADFAGRPVAAVRPGGAGGTAVWIGFPLEALRAEAAAKLLRPFLPPDGPQPTPRQP